jgi:uncharacterized protein (DUF1800 family)
MKFLLCFFIIFSTHVLANSKSNLEDADHLLQRLSYGPRPGEVEALAKKGKLGISAWIDTQLEPQRIIDTSIDGEIKSLPSLSMSNAERLKAYPQKKMLEKMNEAEAKGKELPKVIYGELVSQKIIRAVESERQLQEVLTDFWFNHFNVDFNKGEVKWFITSYERDSIRPNIFGKFKDLLKATAHDPAMLFYLDGHLSVKDNSKSKAVLLNGKKIRGLNENYAREIMELHTLGVDGGYTQKDITEVARALTGWSIEKPHIEGTFVFRPKAHDNGAKQIMSLSLLGGGGQEDGDKVLDYLASRPATAKFIAKKLCIKFISDTPPDSAIKKVADEFMKTDGDLKAVYKKLFTIEEFWDKKYRNVKIKTPLEFVASSIRILGGEVIPFGQDKNQLIGAMDRMGENLYKCQPPTGFKATADFWVNPGALVNRIQLGIALASDRIIFVSSNMSEFKSKIAKSESLDSAIDEVNSIILQNRLSDGVKGRIIQELNSEEKVQAEGSKKNSVKNPKTAIPVVKLVGLMLGSPEFQRR